MFYMLILVINHIILYLNCFFLMDCFKYTDTSDVNQTYDNPREPNNYNKSDNSKGSEAIFNSKNDFESGENPGNAYQDVCSCTQRRIF